MNERATLSCLITVLGHTDKETDSISAVRSVPIAQTGCSFSYDPGSIGSGTVIQYSRTLVQGQISGNSVTTTGGALVPAEGVTLIEASYAASGVASDTSMILTGSGPQHITQPVPELPGVTGDIACILSSTATFTRSGSTATVPKIRSVLPVLQAFAGGSRISPGTWVEIYGENFAAQTRDWTGLLQAIRRRSLLTASA